MFLSLIKGLEKNEAKEDIISVNIQRLLGDKTYEKRKKGAQEIAEVVKLLLLKEKEDKQMQVDYILNEDEPNGKKKYMNKSGKSSGLSQLSQVNQVLYEHDADIENIANKYQNKKVISIINFLKEKFVQSINPAERCGGLIALAFISITVDTQIKFYFSAILKLIVSCVSDPDSKVRYYVCESLYNLCKVSKSVVFYHIEDIFDCLFRIFSDSCPNVKSGGAFLDNLLKDLTCSYNNVFNIYKIIFILKERIGIENSNARQVILSWLLLFQNIKTVNLFEYFHFFISDLFFMLADQNRDIQRQANQCLDLYVDQIITSNYEQVRSFFKHIAFIFIEFCNHKNTIIKHKCLLWLYHFIQILNCLRSNDKQVVLLSLTVLSAMCSTVDNKFHFYEQVSNGLIALFRNDDQLLMHKGKIIVQHISRCLNNKKFFAYLSYSLISEEKISFVTKFIQVLSWVLLTSEETKYLRNALFLKKQYSLFSLILIAWLRNPISAISFLLWLQKYKLAYLICSYLSLLNLNSDFFHQLDNLIFLLESPIFSKQRIHLVYPQNYPFLIKSLMILSLMLPLN
ncbi:hypothetical protein PCYB_145140, partial [Plasmodium cynomolgi strain B]